MLERFPIRIESLLKICRKRILCCRFAVVLDGMPKENKIEFRAPAETFALVSYAKRRPRFTWQQLKFIPVRS